MVNSESELVPSPLPSQERHIARKFSLTSTQSHAYIKALLRHGLDLKYDFICRVLKYMCVNYDYNKRLRKSRERERQENLADESDNNSQSSDCSDEDLLAFGVPETTEASDRPHLEIRLCILKVDKEIMSVDEFKEYIKNWDDKYLTWFLAKVGMAPAKIPKSLAAMKNQCLKWANAAPTHRPFAFKTTAELKEIYRTKKGCAPKSVWKVEQLIKQINSDIPTARPSRGVIDPDSFEQEMVNIAVRGTSLKPLSAEAKQLCQLGHDMEDHFSRELVRRADFPWGRIEEVAKVGLVSKAGKPHIKASVDGLICYLNELDDKELLIVEYKT